MDERLRLVSWNMGNNSVRSSVHQDAWHHLLDAGDGLNADIALVQEAVPPAWISDGHRLLWVQAWPTRPWGTGLVIKGTSDLRAIDRRIEGGRFIGGWLTTSRGDVLLVSVHARTDLLEFIPPLMATFQTIREESATARFIVGGDFNTARRAEDFWPGYGHAEFWRRLDEMEFHSCYWAEHGQEAITYIHPRGPFVGQADHILIDQLTAHDATVTSWVDDSHPALSDHRPLVVDLVWRS